MFAAVLAGRDGPDEAVVSTRSCHITRDVTGSHYITSHVVGCSAADYARGDPQLHANPDSSEGTSRAYVEDLKRRKGADADQPHRIAYKKLVRA